MSLNSPPPPRKNELVVMLPPPDYEMIPPRIEELLRGHGWTRHYTGSDERVLLVNPIWPGYYTWCEAMCIEMAPAFLSVAE